MTTGNIRYRAAVLDAPRRISVREQIFAGKLDPGEALVEVLFSGICGTDIAIWTGDYRVPLPLVPGHEFSGVVTDAAPGSPAAALVGRRVVCEINNSCLAYGDPKPCAACRRGMPTHCLERTTLGIVSHPGSFAEYVRVPAGNIHPIPDSIASDTAVFVEPLAAAIRTFEMSPIGPGEIVLVLGCGRLGRLVTLVASHYGARVVCVGRSQEDLAFVSPFVETCVLMAPDPQAPEQPASPQHVTVYSELELCDLVLGMTQGLGADVVVEATGANRNLRLAQELVRPQGTVALKSTSGVPIDGLDTTLTAVKEIRLQGSRCGPFPKAIAFMQERGLPDRSWITSRYALDKAAAALEAARHEPKVVLACEIGTD